MPSRILIREGRVRSDRKLFPILGKRRGKRLTIGLPKAQGPKVSLGTAIAHFEEIQPFREVASGLRRISSEQLLQAPVKR